MQVCTDKALTHTEIQQQDIIAAQMYSKESVTYIIFMPHYLLTIINELTKHWPMNVRMSITNTTLKRSLCIYDCGVRWSCTSNLLLYLVPHISFNLHSSIGCVCVYLYRGSLLLNKYWYKYIGLYVLPMQAIGLFFFATASHVKSLHYFFYTSQ